ncbi:MAG: PAS domain-containing protein [Elusimicrobia bacterium]|nr:PAS domain-containing protein [Elusimicrobiota bacterium]
MVKNIQEYYQCILDNLTGGLVSVDMSGKVVYINPTAGRILHLESVPGCLDKKYDSAFESFPALRDVIRETIETGKTVRRAEISIMHASTPLIIGYSTMQVRGADGKEMGVTVIFQDISFVAAKK